MKNVIFYHVWLPEKAVKAEQFVKQQVERMQKSGLLNHAEMKVVVTGKASNETVQLLGNLGKLAGVTTEFATNEFVGLFEGVTLGRLYEYCLEHPDTNVLYCHTKGISYLTNANTPAGPWTAIESWKNFLEWGCIDLWKTQVEKLDSHDAAGVNYSLWPWPHFSGNFWWAKAKYIAKLPHPTESDYLADFRDIGDEQRLKYEKWIGMAHPRVYSHANAPLPYDSPFPEPPNAPENKNEPKWFWLYRDDVSPLIDQYMKQTDFIAKRKISVSVVIPGNDISAFTKTLKSLDKQTCYEWECMLLIPDSMEVTALQTELDERHMIVKSEVKPGSIFQAEELNKFVRQQCCGDIVVLLNAGNEPCPDYIAECLIELRMQPETALCFGFETMDKDAQASGKIVYNRLQILASNNVSTPVAFRKSDWDSCGGFDAEMPEEAMFWDLWVRLCDAEKVAVQNPFCIAGSTGWNTSDFENSIYLLRKHKSLLNGLMPSGLVLQTVNQEKLIAAHEYKLSNISLSYTIPELLIAISKKLARRLKRLVK